MAELGVPPLVSLFLFLHLSHYLRLHLPSPPCAWIGICFSFVSLSWFAMRWGVVVAVVVVGVSLPFSPPCTGVSGFFTC